MAFKISLELGKEIVFRAYNTQNLNGKEFSPSKVAEFECQWGSNCGQKFIIENIFCEVLRSVYWKFHLPTCPPTSWRFERFPNCDFFDFARKISSFGKNPEYKSCSPWNALSGTNELGPRKSLSIQTSWKLIFFSISLTKYALPGEWARQRRTDTPSCFLSVSPIEHHLKSRSICTRQIKLYVS